MRPYLENIQQQQQKKADRVAQVVECLSSKCESLSSNPSFAKKKKGESANKKKKGQQQWLSFLTISFFTEVLNSFNNFLQ
jgi:hypothetical protein